MQVAESSVGDCSSGSAGIGGVSAAPVQVEPADSVREGRRGVRPPLVCPFALAARDPPERLPLSDTTLT